VISPLLSNLYLVGVDRMLERAKESTRYGKYTCIVYARFADDLVILIDAHQRHDRLMGGGGETTPGRVCRAASRDQ
jgi:RNA-directed DNA polymerase